MQREMTCAVYDFFLINARDKSAGTIIKHLLSASRGLRTLNEKRKGEEDRCGGSLIP